MWQTKYASAVPKNLGVGVDFGHAVKAISSPDVRSPWYVQYYVHIHSGPLDYVNGIHAKISWKMP